MTIKLNALVIDDSGIMRKVVMESLKKSQLAEFTFTEAEDGKDGLAKLRGGDFHIAFVDWNMPNMSGIEFVRAVRAYEKQEDLEGNIPLVMVTSEKTLSKVEEALDEAGADSFISKPFTVEVLQLKLKKVIEKAQFVAVKRLRSQREAEAPAPAAGKGFLGGLFG